MTQRVIFDTDIGTDVDDAYALAFLARCPEVKIKAVTILPTKCAIFNQKA